VLDEGYSNSTLKAGSYNAHDHFYVRTEKQITPERAAAIRQLVVEWVPSVITNTPMSKQEQDEKVRDLLFATTVAFAGTGRVCRKPRIDFFLLHALTSSHFMLYLPQKLERPENQARLLAGYLSTLFSILLSSDSRKLDAALLMSYTEKPHRPGMEQGEHENSWSAMLPDNVRTIVIHTTRAFRTLLAMAERYGTVAKGVVAGAPDVDGSVFFRAAGVLMEVFDWNPADGGEWVGKRWEWSGIGWDEAWT
jgi:hypothetical protein